MQLNYKQIGDSGRPLIILHGVFGFLDNWLTIGKTISEHGFKVFLVDQRHHGRSPQKGSLDFPTLAADLKEFLDEHKITDPILIGHSMGGKTVMQYAVTYPESIKELVIVDIGPKAYPIHHKKILEGLNAIPIDEIETRHQADEVLSEYEPLLAVRQFLLKNLYRKDEGGFGWRFNLPVLTSDMSKVGSEIVAKQKIEAPTLFIKGENSKYIVDEDWEGILQIFPNARLETISDAGHWVQAEQPKAFVAALLKFLDETI
ncbi:alpha/beta fold hydrolase [Dyadobacter chenwenxiniae]|uniref:Alpha/beta fold hydrolase n=1 Tax=Dyadobacter chenwenxiniae TaxID=2906456 RepID=A0A9X1TD46_9BACT|nr:alpha/beta fold hydrolase [Dyadobacter chenwenxiniae]MCF0060822.1 alpha/beta fold hydrolase [Dyadobacter chenwenxiniae]UON80654.1 alpha/beta fold hydrolase [Dyadobacter chenwenxiniae]